MEMETKAMIRASVNKNRVSPAPVRRNASAAGRMREQSPYLYGSAAPGDFWQEAEPLPVRRSEVEARIARRKERLFRMNLRYAAFMAMLVAAVTFILIGYIKLQADLMRTSREVASLEKQLSEIRAENNENYAEINAGVDLEEVRRIAIQKLGMKNAEKDQIILYSDRKRDTVRQVLDLGN